MDRSTLSVCLISTLAMGAWHAVFADDGQGSGCRIVRISPYSEARISLSCHGCSIQELKEKLAANFSPAAPRLVIDDFSEDVIAARLTPERLLHLETVPFWEAAATIASKLDLVIERAPYTDAAALDWGESGAFRHWTVAGPILLALEMSPRDDVADANQAAGESPTRATINPHFFSDETDQTDIQLYDVVVVGTDGQKEDITPKQYSDGSWNVNNALKVNEISEIRGRLLARIGRDLYTIRISPGERCAETSIGLDASCGPVERIKELDLGFFKYGPPDGFDHLYHTSVEIKWDHAIPWQQAHTWEDVVSDRELLEQTLRAWDDHVDLEFADLLNATPSQRILDESRELFDEIQAPWEAMGLGAALTATQSTPPSGPAPAVGRSSIHVYSHRRDEVETTYEIVMTRKTLIDLPFTIRASAANDNVR